MTHRDIFANSLRNAELMSGMLTSSNLDVVSLQQQLEKRSRSIQDVSGNYFFRDGDTVLYRDKNFAEDLKKSANRIPLTQVSDGRPDGFRFNLSIQLNPHTSSYTIITDSLEGNFTSAIEFNTDTDPKSLTALLEGISNRVNFPEFYPQKTLIEGYFNTNQIELNPRRLNSQLHLIQSRVSGMSFKLMDLHQLVTPQEINPASILLKTFNIGLEFETVLSILNLEKINAKEGNISVSKFAEPLYRVGKARDLNMIINNLCVDDLTFPGEIIVDSFDIFKNIKEHSVQEINPSTGEKFEKPTTVVSIYVDSDENGHICKYLRFSWSGEVMYKKLNEKGLTFADIIKSGISTSHEPNRGNGMFYLNESVNAANGVMYMEYDKFSPHDIQEDGAIRPALRNHLVIKLPFVN